MSADGHFLCLFYAFVGFLIQRTWLSRQEKTAYSADTKIRNVGTVFKNTLCRAQKKVNETFKMFNQKIETDRS